MRVTERLHPDTVHVYRNVFGIGLPLLGVIYGLDVLTNNVTDYATVPYNLVIERPYEGSMVYAGLTIDCDDDFLDGKTHMSIGTDIVTVNAEANQKRGRRLPLQFVEFEGSDCSHAYDALTMYSDTSDSVLARYVLSVVDSSGETNNPAQGTIDAGNILYGDIKIAVENGVNIGWLFLVTPPRFERRSTP